MKLQFHKVILTKSDIQARNIRVEYVCDTTILWWSVVYTRVESGQGVNVWYSRLGPVRWSFYL